MIFQNVESALYDELKAFASALIGYYGSVGQVRHTTLRLYPCKATGPTAQYEQLTSIPASSSSFAESGHPFRAATCSAVSPYTHTTSRVEDFDDRLTYIVPGDADLDTGNSEEHRDDLRMFRALHERRLALSQNQKCLSRSFHLLNLRPKQLGCCRLRN